MYMSYIFIWWRWQGSQCPVSCIVPEPTPASVKKHSSGEEYLWEDKPSEHQIGGWRAVNYCR